MLEASYSKMSIYFGDYPYEANHSASFDPPDFNLKNAAFGIGAAIDTNGEGVFFFEYEGNVIEVGRSNETGLDGSNGGWSQVDIDGFDRVFAVSAAAIDRSRMNSQERKEIPTDSEQGLIVILCMAVGILSLASILIAVIGGKRQMNKRKVTKDDEMNDDGDADSINPYYNVDSENPYCNDKENNDSMMMETIQEEEEGEEELEVANSYYGEKKSIKDSSEYLLEITEENSYYRTAEEDEEEKEEVD